MQSFRVLLLMTLISLLIVACNANPPQDTATEEPESQTDNSGINAPENVDPETAESRGRALFVQMIDETGFACASCHYLTEARLIGPGLGNIATRVESYDLDMSLEEYVRESITHPQEYIVEGEPEYPPNVMPSTYADVFTEDQLNDLVAYVLSLN